MSLATDLADSLARARRVTQELTEDLTDEELRLQPDPKFSPIGWHVGHVAWQEELWILRRALGQAPLDRSLDSLFDSFVSEKGGRAAALPSRGALLDYQREVRGRCLEALKATPLAGHGAGTLLERGAVFRFVANHERQHAETVGVARLLAGLTLTQRSGAPSEPEEDGASRWVSVPGGTTLLGAAGDEDAWDNERGAHEVRVEAFELGRDPVTVADYQAFVAAGGYRERRFWSDDGWAARSAGAWEGPRHWVTRSGELHQRSLRGGPEGLRPVLPSEPVAFLSWHEASAYAAFAGARLPTEAEWERAARIGVAATDERWPTAPWDCRSVAPGAYDLECVTRGQATEAGLRGLLGGVWEWTSSVFAPYPGFEPQHYRGYSAPWFDGRHRVARGGCFLTQAEIARSTFRNFFEPHIRELPLGLRLAR